GLYIWMTVLMNNVVKRVDGILNAILNLHRANIPQQIPSSSLQIRLRGNQFYPLEIGPIAYHKHLVRVATTTLHGKTFLRDICGDHHVSCPVRTPFQKEEHAVQRPHTMFEFDLEHLR